MTTSILEEKTIQPRILKEWKTSMPTLLSSPLDFWTEEIEDLEILIDEDFQKGFGEAHARKGKLLDELTWLR